eukprot:scaffold4511_cov171-Amphora_coffeaeformis.AAC.7
MMIDSSFLFEPQQTNKQFNNNTDNNRKLTCGSPCCGGIGGAPSRGGAANHPTATIMAAAPVLSFHALPCVPDPTAATAVWDRPMPPALAEAIIRRFPCCTLWPKVGPGKPYEYAVIRIHKKPVRSTSITEAIMYCIGPSWDGLTMIH